MADKEIKVDVVVVGAGLTGLTAAFYLQRRGKRVVVAEKSNRAGGVINTIDRDGFVFETGPNTGVLSTAEMAMLFDDLGDRCRLEKASPLANSRWIWKNGKWNPLPSGIGSAVSTPLFTFGDKIRVLLEPLRKRGEDPLESVAGLVRRRLGATFLDYAVDPFISGIYAGDPEYLVTKYALPKLYRLEQSYGSFVGGAVAKMTHRKSPAEALATREVFSVEGGLSNLINALSDAVGSPNIITGCENVVAGRSNGTFLTRFSHDGKNYTIGSDYLITTCGSSCLNSVLSFASEAELKNICNLQYARVAQVIAGYRTWNGTPLMGFGGLVPSREKREILGILFTSSFLKGRAPEGGALLSVFLGGYRNPGLVEMSDDAIASTALREAGDMLWTGGAVPDLVEVARYTHAIPQYGKDSAERLMSIETLERRNPGLIVAGNVRDGIGMADRVKQAVTIANMIP